MPRCARLLSVAIGSAALIGCVGAHLTHLDPAFTSAALNEGGLAIGGVAMVGTAEKLDAREAAAVIDFIERGIKKRRPEIGLLAHSVVKETVGPSRLESLAAEAAAGDSIEPAPLEQLAPLAPLAPLAELAGQGARYVFFAVITYNAVDRHVTSHTDVRNIYDDEGNVTGRSVKYFTIAQAKRSVSAEYRIFDVATGERMWTSESSTSRSRGRSAESGDGYPPAPDYAPAPTVSRVVRAMSTAAIKELPMPEKQPKKSAAPTIRPAPPAAIAE